MQALALDHVSPATRRLEKRRQMFEIQEALEEVMEGKTVLAIAHRLSTIARMDRIIVMEDGHIVEQGTHADLLARNGTYARFWNRQSGGFIGVAAAAE